MSAVWWVNHKQSYREETGLGYIWSPKRKSDGAKSHFYDNVSKVKPGDRVISFASGQIRNVGSATSAAQSSAKPNANELKDSVWNLYDGWLVAVDWDTLDQSITPKNEIDAMRPFLPSKYAPISRETGNGNQGAYLSKVDDGLLSYILDKQTDSLTTSFLIKGGGLEAAYNENADDILERAVDEDKSLDQTQRKQVVMARRGQGKFRENLRLIESRCRLTGVTDERLLIASHMLPWRNCLTAQERLDGNNGLLLSPTADALFDKGLISFSDEGDVLVGEKISVSTLSKLGFHGLFGANVGAFNSEQKIYLAKHRALFGFH